MNIINKSNNRVLANKVIVADTFINRLKGLMFEKSLGENTAIIIFPCNAIHTFFMRFSLDVIFISKENEVLYIIENMLPKRISPFIKRAKSVLELPAGTIKKTKTKKNDFLIIH